MPQFQFQTILDYKKTEHEKMLLILIQIEHKIETIREEIKSKNDEKIDLELKIQTSINKDFSIFRVQMFKEGINYLKFEINELEKELGNLKTQYEKQQQLVKKAQIEIEKFQIMREDFFSELNKKRKEKEKKELDEVAFIQEFHKRKS
ncbi:flagellar FliJ family protein [bacterium]|nr:flagellar FliJ family protein [bacterium]